MLGVVLILGLLATPQDGLSSVVEVPLQVQSETSSGSYVNGWSVFITGTKTVKDTAAGKQAGQLRRPVVVTPPITVLHFAHCNLRLESVCPSSTPAEEGAVSISDIATFTPQVGSAHMQPVGWMVIKTNTNFYSKASSHVVTGTLLGNTAQVRFTPVGYYWDYGDGAAKTVQTPGGNWEALGLQELSETPASHVYVERGEYTIIMRTIYSAEYLYDTETEWTTISGTLSVASPPLEVRAYSVKTVLVDETCDENPAGVGCTTE